MDDDSKNKNIDYILIGLLLIYVGLQLVMA